MTPPGFIGAYRKFCEDGWISLAAPYKMRIRNLAAFYGVQVLSGARAHEAVVRYGAEAVPKVAATDLSPCIELQAASA